MKKAYLILIPLMCILASKRTYAQVNADFSINYQYPNCSPTVVTFVNSSTGLGNLTYEWNFGQGFPGVNSTQTNPSATYEKCGTYNVTLTAINQNGKRSTVTKKVITNCEPVANFTVTGGQGCLPTSVSFTSTSLSGSGSIVDYVWDFGDGYKGTGANPSHTYTTIGCKTVTLVITNSNGCIDDTTFTNIVCPADAPEANFTSSNANSCYAPLTVTYKDSSSGPNTPFTYKWNFPGGNPSVSSSATPSVTYDSSGFYNTQLIITNSKGCSDTVTKNNYVLIGTNIADFKISSTKGCTPLSVFCEVLGNSGVLNVEWEATGSSTPSGNGREFLTTYTSPGTYQLCMSATYPGNCVVSKCTTITVGSRPKADFTVTGNNPTCTPPLNNVTFTNKSTGVGSLSYQWDFQGGSPSSSDSLTPPPVNYTSCGKFTVSLIVIDQGGCSDTLRRDSLIRINCPEASVVVSAQSGCIPYDVTLNSTGSTGNPVKWWWNFGDTTNTSIVQSTKQNPSHVFSKVGCFDVQLITENALGCRDTVNLQKFICTGKKPKANFSASPKELCAGLPVTFTNLSTGIDNATKYYWDFQGSPPFNVMSTIKHPKYTYADTGVFDVAIIVSNNGCNDTLNIPELIKVKPPIAVLTVDKNCINKDDITLLGDKSVGADTYEWTIPGGIPASSNNPAVNVHFNKTGDYEAVLTVTNNRTGCSNTIKKPIYIRHVKSDFTTTNREGCPPFQVCLTNLSVEASTYQWFVSDQNGKLYFWGKAESPCPTLTYPGVYDVMLIATDINGCSDTINKPQYITLYGLTAAFTGVKQDCAPVTVQFTDLSKSSTSYPVAWNWDFGDPLSGTDNYSTLQNPSHTYERDGIYQAVLAVTDNHGCISTYTPNGFTAIASKPIVKFQASDTLVCLGNSICFKDMTGGAIKGFSYKWNFGDNSPISTEPNPCYTYKDTGWYHVKLVVKNLWGCKDSLTKSNYIHVITPSANFIADSTSTSCPPLQVHFTNLSIGIDTTTKWQWDFGDGATSTAKEPFHIYTKPGSFDVKLKMTIANGCSNTITFKKYINITGPVANVTVTPTAGCAPLKVAFKAKSANTISYIWDFGDGGVQQLGYDTVSYKYDQNGIYHPKLILNDGVGCVYALPLDSVTVSIPTAKFGVTPRALCNNGQVSFSDSSNSLVDITKWNWNFGDPTSGANNISSQQNPVHNFTSAGTRTISLQITDKLGCTASSTDSVIVYPNPKAEFDMSASAICPVNSIQFTDKSTSVDPIKTYQWNFSDPISGTQNNSSISAPSHLFNNPGTYSVKLFISSTAGCVDSVQQTVTVRNYPPANAGSDKMICINNSVTLTASGGSDYEWTPASTLNTTTGASVIASPTATTTYTVNVTDAFGCTASDVAVIAVNPLPMISAGTDKVICSGDKITLNGSGGNSYEWTPATGLNNSTSASPVASPTVTTVYSLKGLSAHGCISYDSVLVTVNPLPVVSAGNDTEICFGETTTLNATGGISFLWSPAGSLSKADIASPVASPTQTTNYIVTATDANNCKGKDTVQVLVHLLPNIYAGADVNLCEGASTTLQATGGVDYSWSPSTDLSSSVISNPVANPIQTVKYLLHGIDAFGCENSDSVTVKVIHPITITVTPKADVCEGGTVQLFASGGQIYNWAPAKGLENPNMPTPYASPSKSINYQVIASDGLCFSDTGYVFVEVHPLPKITASADVIIVAGDKTQLSATGTNNGYSWSPSEGLSCTDCSEPMASPDATTTYTVSYTNDMGCRAEDYVVVFVGCPGDVMYIPNAFTPDGDGENDKFYVRSQGLKSIDYIRIYDRWGKKVFETANQSEGWDGTLNGKPLVSGVYVYYVQAICSNGETVIRQGNITLIR